MLPPICVYDLEARVMQLNGFFIFLFLFVFCFHLQLSKCKFELPAWNHIQSFGGWLNEEQMGFSLSLSLPLWP